MGCFELYITGGSDVSIVTSVHYVAYSDLFLKQSEGIMTKLAV